MSSWSLWVGGAWQTIIEWLSPPPPLGKDSFSCANQMNSVNNRCLLKKKVLISLICYRNSKLGDVWVGLVFCLLFCFFFKWRDTFMYRANAFSVTENEAVCWLCLRANGEWDRLISSWTNHLWNQCSNVSRLEVGNVWGNCLLLCLLACSCILKEGKQAALWTDSALII